MDIVVWGAGVWGKRCMSFLPHYDINVVAVIDSDLNKQGSEYFGVPIISLELYQKKYSDIIVLIAVSNVAVSKEIEFVLDKANIVYFSLLDCPSELYWTHVSEKVPFHEYIDESAGEHINNYSGEVLAVRGWNLFSLFLYNYLKYKGEKVYWIISSKKKIKNIRAFFKSYDFILDDDIDKLMSIKYVFCTSIFEYIVHKSSNDIPFFRFDIARYRNDRLKVFRKKYDGHRCFVIANGPSLRMEDLQCLYEHGELCFGVNGIYHAFQRTNWRPDFYVAADPRMLEYFSENILSLDVPYKFLGDDNVNFWTKNLPSNVYRFHTCAVFDMECGIPFSEDVSVCTYGAGTIIYNVLQLAVYMGFREIYIIGADCQLVAGKPEHFTVEYCSIKNMKYRLRTDLIMVGYEAAKKYADAHGIKIYNATRGGALEVFERVNFDEIF